MSIGNSFRQSSSAEASFSTWIRRLCQTLLELCRELAYRMLAHCNFCPWNCQVDRVTGAKFGACKLASGSRVSSHFHHTGEELFYRGTQGSGTIFFTSCNMRCAFCQNGDISTDKDNGEEADPRTLAAMAWTLRREGCHNINWVGGEVVIHLHAIVDAIALLGRDFTPTPGELKRARKTKADRFLWFDEVPGAATYEGKFNAPMLWNSNFFMTPESMKILRVLTDVWLPDFKFGPGRCAMTLAKTPWYWETVTRNIALLTDWGEDLSIRHLVMPNHVECCTYLGTANKINRLYVTFKLVRSRNERPGRTLGCTSPRQTEREQRTRV
jgi:putative pyruvate formate lyase activating enzyme